MSNQSFDLGYIFSTLVEILNRSVTIFTKKLHHRCLTGFK